jgi:hypothetical protein
MTRAPGSVDVREAVGVFDRATAFQAAIDELLTSGFDRADLSVLAASDAVDAKLGHHYSKIADLEENPDAPREAYTAPEAFGEAQGALASVLLYVGAITATGVVIASGGAVAAAIGAAALAGGTGAAIGAVLGKFLGKDHADTLQDQIDRGGLLLWVRTRDTAHESSAKAILAKHGATGVHVHTIPLYE